MKTATQTTDLSGNVFLTGTILMANFNYPDLVDYALKAAIGATIWMVFKVVGDFISEKLKNRK